MGEDVVILVANENSIDEIVRSRCWGGKKKIKERKQWINICIYMCVCVVVWVIYIVSGDNIIVVDGV